MHRGDNIVELLQYLVLEVEATVFQDVALDPGEQFEPITVLLIQGIDLIELCQQAIFI